MKVNWKAEIPLIALIVGMWLAAAWMWPSSPGRFPVHWGPSGEVDRYGGRAEGLLLMPAIAVVIYLLMLFVPRLDPGRMNYAKFAGAWYTMRASSLALLALLYAVTLLSARGCPSTCRASSGSPSAPCSSSWATSSGSSGPTGSSACGRPGRSRASSRGTRRIGSRAGYSFSAACS